MPEELNDFQRQAARKALKAEAAAKQELIEETILLEIPSKIYYVHAELAERGTMPAPVMSCFDLTGVTSTQFVKFLAPHLRIESSTVYPQGGEISVAELLTPSERGRWAIPADEVGELLKNLIKHPLITLAVVSGRRLETLGRNQKSYDFVEEYSEKCEAMLEKLEELLKSQGILES